MGVLIILFGTLRIQHWVLRHRAERLLADIQQVELRKTSFEDAQKLFDRWSKWGQYKGECMRQRCLFSIVFTDFWIVTRVYSNGRRSTSFIRQ